MDRSLDAALNLLEDVEAFNDLLLGPLLRSRRSRLRSAVGSGSRDSRRATRVTLRPILGSHAEGLSVRDIRLCSFDALNLLPHEAIVSGREAVFLLWGFDNEGHSRAGLNRCRRGQRQRLVPPAVIAGSLTLKRPQGVISGGERLHHRGAWAEVGEVVAVAALDGHRVHQPLAWNPNREHGVAVGAAHVAQVLGLRDQIHACLLGGRPAGEGEARYGGGRWCVSPKL